MTPSKVSNAQREIMYITAVVEITLDAMVPKIKKIKDLKDCLMKRQKDTRIASCGFDVASFDEKDHRRHKRICDGIRKTIEDGLVEQNDIRIFISTSCCLVEYLIEKTKKKEVMQQLVWLIRGLNTLYNTFEFGSEEFIMNRLAEKCGDEILKSIRT